MSPAIRTRTKPANSSPRDYGYANARVRGMRSRLMRADELERFMGAPDVQHFIQELLQTDYATDVEEAIIQGRTQAQVAEALRNNLVRTYRKVLGILNDESLDICKTLLGRWDVFNIKSILRGKHVGLSAAEIGEGLLPVGALGQVDLDGLLLQSDIHGVVDTAVTWAIPQAPAMREGYVAYQKSGELADLELALDDYYAKWAVARLDRRNANYKLARQILGMQVDILNLVMVFRVAREDLKPGEADSYFLLGGNDVDLEFYQAMTALSDVDEILDALRKTRFGPILDDAAMTYLETMSISAFERALEDYLTRRIIALGGTDPLGAGIPIAYLWSKANEVTNLRIISKAIAIGIPGDRARKELILV